MKTSKIVLSLALIACGFAANAQELYKDESAPIEARVEDLLSRMTVEQKMEVLRTTYMGNLELGIPKYFHGNEALHGVVRPGRFTVFPQAIGLAAMWDEELHHEIATAISDEARARWNELDQGRNQKSLYSDLLTFWSPTLNLARDPRWGRTPETYGEDPFLTGRLGVAFVSGLQGDDPKYLKVVSTPKHFAANNEDQYRFKCDAIIPEKIIREYYLPGYEMAVKEAHPAAIMAAYNAINGVPCHCNPWLLTTVLRNEWGFNGYVVSDCGGPGLIVNGHHYVKNYHTAATLAMNAGLDLECGDHVYVEGLQDAYNRDMVDEDLITRSARRVLTSKMRLGMFDSEGSNPYTKIDPSVIGCQKHQDLALKSAREAIVLLKNSNATLPLKKGKIKSIAVVGVNAGRCELGDYSGTPTIAPVSILQAIKDKAGSKIKVNYAPWRSPSNRVELIEGKNFPGGLTIEYYKGKDLKNLVSSEKVNWVNFEPSNQAPNPLIPEAPLSVRWTGKLLAETSGKYIFKHTFDGTVRIWIDGEIMYDRWEDYCPAQSYIFEKELEGGKEYDIKIEYAHDRDYSLAKLEWERPEQEAKERIDLYGNAGKVAKESDIVIAVMGIDKSIEREGTDREDILLPEDQREFIRELYKINKNVVLVLVAGSSIALNWEEDNLPAIIDSWYGGEYGGTAVADVLFGDYNPAGRLPLTFYKSTDDMPSFHDYDITKGRTYKYFTGEPLYEFGYGLSYTSFTYNNLKVEDSEKGLNVCFDLKNSGKKDGEEVPQVYVRLKDYEGACPIKELRGFKRVFLKKGETKNVNIFIPKEQLRYWSECRGEFVITKETPTVMVGASSSDIRLKN